MEKLRLAYLTLQQMLKTWENAFLFEQKVISAQMSLDFEYAAQDSLIQRFEYCYDAFWKYAKSFLEVRYNVVNVSSPRAVFRELLQQKICSIEEVEVLLHMSDTRNETTHRYGIEKVTQLLPDLKQYYTVMRALVDKLVPS